MSLRAQSEAQQSAGRADGGHDHGVTPPGPATGFANGHLPARQAGENSSTEFDRDRTLGGGIALLTRDLSWVLTYPELRRTVTVYAALLLGLLAAALWLT